MAKQLLKFASAVALCAFTATSGIADTQAITAGAVITPEQSAHIFDAACTGTAPSTMADTASILVDMFGFETIDLGTDAGWISPNGGITLTVDGDATAATCTMSIVADISGDGSELYESLEAHLSDHLDGSLPEADYIDGGVVWRWDGSDTAYVLEFYEVEGAFGITLTAKG